MIYVLRMAATGVALGQTTLVNVKASSVRLLVVTHRPSCEQITACEGVEFNIKKKIWNYIFIVAKQFLT